MKHIFIVNPTAGKGKALNTVKQIEKICKEILNMKFIIQKHQKMRLK